MSDLNNHPSLQNHNVVGDAAERKDHPEEEMSFGVGETYSILARILMLKPMMLMVVFLLTAKIAFAATDGMTDLKFIAAGLTTDKIASRSIFLTPLHVSVGESTSPSPPI